MNELDRNLRINFEMVAQLRFCHSNEKVLCFWACFLFLSRSWFICKRVKSCALSLFYSYILVSRVLKILCGNTYVVCVCVHVLTSVRSGTVGNFLAALVCL